MSYGDAGCLALHHWCGLCSYSNGSEKTFNTVLKLEVNCLQSIIGIRPCESASGLWLKSELAFCQVLLIVTELTVECVVGEVLATIFRVEKHDNIQRSVLINRRKSKGRAETNDANREFKSKIVLHPLFSYIYHPTFRRMNHVSFRTKIHFIIFRASLLQRPSGGRFAVCRDWCGICRVDRRVG